MIGFAIAILALGFIMGYVNKKETTDEEGEVDEVVEENEPLYLDDSKYNTDKDESMSDEEPNDVSEKTSDDLEKETMERLEEIAEKNEDDSFIEYDEEYETVFSLNKKFGKKTVSSAVKTMHEIIALHFKKGGSDIEAWKPLVTKDFFKKVKSGEMDTLVYTHSDVIEVQSVPLETKSDNLVLGGVVTTLDNEMYLHEYEFEVSKDKVLLSNLKFIWKH